MKPSTVFKILIGTVIVLAVSTLFIELANVQLASSMLTEVTGKSVRQACTLFGQETYKREDAQHINEENLVSADSAAIYVSGEFYSYGSAQAIYNGLYAYNTGFRLWLKDHSGYWSSMDAMANAMDSTIALGADSQIGEIYKENMMTPLNLGITYLDEGTVEKIARWNLTSLLLNGVQDTSGAYVNMHQDADGVYVSYKGYKVYTSQLDITSIDYEVVDLTTTAGRNKYEEYSHMSADTILANMGSSVDERKYVCFASVKYSVPVHYEGITPIKKVAEYFWNYEVTGFTYGTNSAGVNNDAGKTFNIGKGTLSGGGFTGNANLLVPGTVIYFVTR